MFRGLGFREIVEVIKEVSVKTIVEVYGLVFSVFVEVIKEVYPPPPPCDKRRYPIAHPILPFLLLLLPRAQLCARS